MLSTHSAMEFSGHQSGAGVETTLVRIKRKGNLNSVFVRIQADIVIMENSISIPYYTCTK